MIVEIRTYTLQPGTVPQFEERFAQALPARAKVSPLAAFWHTEVGPLNQVIHVWPYDDLEERTRKRAEATKLDGWPPNTREFVVEQKSQDLSSRRRSRRSSSRASSAASTRSASTRCAPARSRSRSSAGPTRSANAPSCRRWPSPAIPNSAI